MRRLLSAGLVAVVVLALLAGAVALIGAYTFLPSMLEASVARDVQERFDPAETPEVRLKSDPQLAVLAGTFSGGRISLRGVELGGVRAESVTVDLEAFDVDMSSSVLQGELVGEAPISGRLRVQVSEAEVSRLAGENAGTPVSDVELQAGRAVVGSRATMLGLAVPVSVAGSLSLRGGSLVFKPEDLQAAGVPVPGEVSDQLLAGTEFAYPLRGLPERTRVTNARVEKGRLVLTGEMEEMPLGVTG